MRMEVESLDYPDAVRFLAKRAGLEVPEDEGYRSAYKKQERLMNLCREAARFFHDQLSRPSAEEVRAYIQKRALSRETVTRFGLGYSPNEWSALIDAMTKKGYEKEELLEAGLAVKSQKGSIYDRFRNRLMLSTAAFNALLKIIEEPPEHLLFILATTELHKVPATILSRCQRFSFRRLLPEDIAARLNYVAYQEKIELEPDAAQLLARLADGALRDGLSLLDQCASASEGPVTAELVYRSLGLAGDRRTAELMNEPRNTPIITMTSILTLSSGISRISFRQPPQQPGRAVRVVGRRHDVRDLSDGRQRVLRRGGRARVFEHPPVVLVVAHARRARPRCRARHRAARQEIPRGSEGTQPHLARARGRPGDRRLRGLHGLPARPLLVAPRPGPAARQPLRRDRASGGDYAMKRKLAALAALALAVSLLAGCSQSSLSWLKSKFQARDETVQAETAAASASSASASASAFWGFCTWSLSFIYKKEWLNLKIYSLMKIFFYNFSYFFNGPM